MGGYVGSNAFVVVLGEEGQVKYLEMGNSRELDLVGTACAKAVASLPPAPAETATRAGGAGSASAGSLADELKQLAELKASGALTEAEFEAAKQRVLSSGKTP
ncbi:hypothetical protein C9412_04955 [Stenotrophomonas sp. Nf1]|nr:hypothetical protein C9412_04955 [Stenotrophomonas sp. Nf1]PTA82500.1 hypothetical protein C9416_04105 [Stenotrophomonas sp. Nf4]